MRILLVANKTYRGLPDSILWYFLEPMNKLGHEVYFYDTVENYLVCISFPSFALGLVWKTYITLVNNQTQNLNQS